MKQTARTFTVAVMFAAVAACSAMEPPGTVRLDEAEFQATMEEVDEDFGPVIDLVIAAQGGELINSGQTEADLERCGEPYADDLAQIYALAGVLIDGRPKEDAIIDELEPQMNDLGWTREPNPDGTSRFVRTTETGVTLDLFIGVGQGPDTPRNSDLRLSISGTCMRLPASPFELGY